jgi:hypothetical protein
MNCQCVQFQVSRGVRLGEICSLAIDGEDLLCGPCRTDAACTRANGTDERKARRAAEKAQESAPAGLALPDLPGDGNL